MFMASGDPRITACFRHDTIESEHFGHHPHLHGMLRRATMAHVHPASAAMTDRSIARPLRLTRRKEMLKKTGWVSAGLTLAALSTLASVALSTAPAEAAVIYCKTAGVPQGCVIRPTVPVVAATGVRATAVRATSVRVTRVRVASVGRVDVGRHGTPWNRGGPVNRIGRR
jgi:hypothetical protein